MQLDLDKPAHSRNRILAVTMLLLFMRMPVLMILVEPALEAQISNDECQRHMPTIHDDTGGTSYKGTDAT